MPNNNKLFSFDVYDTCVTRLCGESNNVFYLLASKFLGNTEIAKIRAFVEKRIEAEKKAEIRYGKEAVTIDEIYSVLDISHLTSVENNEVMKMELRIEENILSPILETVNLIRKCRRQGSILFVSDMYLSSDFIKTQLIKFGIFLDGDEIYVSSEVGLSKKSGSLFDYIKKRTEVTTWTHYGDNIYSDYIIPKKKGINAIRLHTGYSSYEKMWMRDNRFCKFPMNISVFAGLIRSSRLMYYIGGKDQFVPNIMIPFLLTFVATVIDDAKRKNIKALYFASRDAYGMYLVAKELLKSEDDISVKYINISTKTLYPIYVVNGDREEVLYILKLLNRFKPISVLKMFGFNDDEILDFSDLLDVNSVLSESDDKFPLFLERICRIDNKKILKRRCAEKRNILIDYFKQEGVINDCNFNVAIVDLGWRLTCQQMINMIVNNNVNYYYFGVSKTRLDFDQTSDFISMSFWEDFRDIYKNNAFIEYYICRNYEGSTIGYDRRSDKIVPVKASVPIEISMYDIDFNMRLLVDAAKSYSKIGTYFVDTNELFRNVCFKTLVSFTKLPPKHITDYLSNRLYVDHFSGKKSVIIKLYPWTCFYVLFIYVFKKKIPNNTRNKFSAVWFTASLIHTYGRLGNWVVKLYWMIIESLFLKEKWRLIRSYINVSK